MITKHEQNMTLIHYFSQEIRQIIFFIFKLINNG